MIDLNLLHAYADGELTAAEQAVVDQQLAACKASQAELEAIKNLKNHLLCAPSNTCNDTWKACQSRLDGIDRVKKSENFVTRYSWLLVTGVAMFVLAGGYVSRITQAGSVDSGSFAGVFSNSRTASPGDQIRNAQLDAILRHADQQLHRVRLVSQTTTEVNGQLVPRYELVDSVGTLFLVALPPVTGFDSMEKTSGNYYRSCIDGDKNIVAWKTENGAMILMGKRSHEALEESAKKNFVPPIQ